MSRKTTIETWRKAKADYDADLNSQHKTQTFVIAREAMREFVSENESLGAIEAGVTCKDILGALEAVARDFEPQPYYARRSWFGDRYDRSTGISRPGDEAMHRVAGVPAGRLAELILGVQWGQVGSCFVTNRRDGWTSNRILTLYVNRRPRAKVYDRDSGVTVYFIPTTAAEWIFAIERRRRREASAAYATALVEARRDVAATLDGAGGTPWTYESGQDGGVVRGEFGLVSARGAGFNPYDIWSDGAEVCGSEDVRREIRQEA